MASIPVSRAGAAQGSGGESHFKKSLKGRKKVFKRRYKNGGIV